MRDGIWLVSLTPVEHHVSINTIIFSKDRATQLDALLRSLIRFAPQLLPATVLFLATEDRYREAYRILIAEHPSKVFFLQQGSSFRDDLLSLILPDTALTTMLVDDDVFYRSAPLVPKLQSGQCFSFRLGQNIQRDYVTRKEQVPGSENFRYSYSLDGHVFRTDDLLPLVRCLEFDCPNRLEAYMQRSGQPLEIFYDQHSSLVGIPHNLVQTAWPQVSMGGSAEELNDRFLVGERIDLDMMDFSDVRATHQDILYSFRRKVEEVV
jgi:hypothetical protein